MTTRNPNVLWMRIVFVAVIAATADSVSLLAMGRQAAPAPTLRKVADRKATDTHSFSMGTWSISQPGRGRVSFTTSNTVIDPDVDTFFIWEVRVFRTSTHPVTGELIVGEEPVLLRGSTTSDFFVRKDQGGTYEIAYQLTNLTPGAYKAWFFLNAGRTSSYETGEYETETVRSVQFVAK